MAPKLDVVVENLNYADIDACAQISKDSFAVDPHTIVKELGRDGYDMYAMARDGYLRNLERDIFVFVKAVDTATRQVVGYCGWVFPHVDKALIPWTGPSDAKPEAKEEGKKQETTEDDQDKEPDTKREPDAIDRLHKLEDEDMQYWQKNITPKGPHMIIMGLGVAPAHQGRGVGSALLRYGNAIADKLGLSISVHSSHQAVDAYAKAGFVTTRKLDVDLDEYAPRPPKDDEPVMGDKGTGKWGHYVIQYMKREPAKAGEN